MQVQRMPMSGGADAEVAASMLLVCESEQEMRECLAQFCTWPEKRKEEFVKGFAKRRDKL